MAVVSPQGYDCYETLRAAGGETVGVQFTIDVHERLVLCTYYGEINDAELFDIASVIRSHPDFDPLFSEIVDFSGVTGVAVSSFAIQTNARQESIFSLTSRKAVIAPQAHIFGLARMFQVYAGTNETKHCGGANHQ